MTALFRGTATKSMDPFLQVAIDEAKEGLADGGIPIGSVLVCDGKIIGRGHNQRVQRGSVIHHGEMNCLENAGRLKASVYKRCTIFSTLSPCPMCSGAILLYGIPRVIIGERKEETPAVLVHCRVSDPTERGRLRDDIRERVRAITGITPIVELVPPRSLPRTSSGKLSRTKARNLYLSGEIQPFDIAA